MANHSLLYDLMGRFRYNQRTRSRFLLLAIVSAVVIVCLLQLPLLEGLRPDFYQPARPALTRAKIHLSAFYVDEESLLAELSKAHRQLLMTLAQLAKAKSQLSPEDRAVLERLRNRLRELEDERTTGHMTPEELHQTYRNMVGELEALIDRSD